MKLKIFPNLKNTYEMKIEKNIQIFDVFQSK